MKVLAIIGFVLFLISIQRAWLVRKSAVQGALTGGGIGFLLYLGVFLPYGDVWPFYILAFICGGAIFLAAFLPGGKPLPQAGYRKRR